METKLRSPLDDVGEQAVEAPIMCSISRFGLRSARSLFSSYREYRRVMQEASSTTVEGLLRSAFLVENPRTWYSLSIWSGRPVFSAQVPAHVEAARKVFGSLSVEPERGPELWTTKWRLVSVTNNLNWDGFDLRRFIADLEE